jgi:multiple sugar transport system substrate-binding protein
MTKLRGLAWDHRRCWGPLEASASVWRASHPSVQITWDRRSLHAFGEAPLEAVLGNYDLVIYDHPFVGEIAEGALMVPFDDHLSAEERTFFEQDSVGKSWQSYQRNGRQWALPIDAACQVASYRTDLLARIGAVPTNHQEVLALGRAARTEGRWIGLPLVPTDAMCLILTFTNPSAEGESFVERAAVERAVGELRELAELAHPLSTGWNPILCYDRMVTDDDVVYVPFAFGSVNYAARTNGRRLAFADIPRTDAAGALLGGAGIGIGAQSPNREAAIAYARHLCSPEVQRTIYVEAGGQPGSLQAWRDPDVNAATGGFFADTLKTIQASYLRPTHAGFLAFFRDCAPRAAAAIAGELSANEFFSFLDRRYRESLGSTVTGRRRLA